MKRFHQILDNTIQDNLKQFIKIAQCLHSYIDRIPKEEILHHLKINRQRMRNSFLPTMTGQYSKEMEPIDRSLKKFEKGDFNIYDELIEKSKDLKEFYMDPEERDRLADSNRDENGGMRRVKKSKKIRKEAHRGLAVNCRSKMIKNDEEEENF